MIYLVSQPFIESKNSKNSGLISEKIQKIKKNLY